MKSGGPLSIRTLIIIMVAVVILGVLIARSYYGNVNRSVDPRIRPARELYDKYNGYALKGDFQNIFALMDSIEQIYLATPHYRNSFELGVIENNRAAALLTIALYRDSISESANPLAGLSNDSLVSMAERQARRAIANYDNWSELYSGKSKEEIRERIEPGFMEGLEAYKPDQAELFLVTRIGEIEKSIHENDRRLSVCYTNLGLVYRTRGKYQMAVKSYEKAMSLWDRNLDAENNLNKLLNRPMKKRNFIQKMFPPGKDG